MNIISNKVIASASGLVRLACSPSGNWIVADNDMSAGFVWRRGDPAFRPLVQATWLRDGYRPSIGAGIDIPEASRCYLGSVVDTADGGCIACFKLGVKEVEDAWKAGNKHGLPFEKCAWGVYLLGLDSNGNTLWHGRADIHKGNAQIVRTGTDEYRLVATEGICWIYNSRGILQRKTRIVLGKSGEKIYVTSDAASFVGFTGTPSAVARFNVDPKAVAVMSKPPYDTGSDFLRCSHCRSGKNPGTIWWALPLNGKLYYNCVAEGASVAKWNPAALKNGGKAVSEARHPAALFPIAGVLPVGAAFKCDGSVVVQVVNKASTRKTVGPGGWACATVLDKVHVFYLNGGALREAIVDASA